MPESQPIFQNSIAQVFEAGKSTDGLPVYKIELAQGVPVSDDNMGALGNAIRAAAQHSPKELPHVVVVDLSGHAINPGVLTHLQEAVPQFAPPETKLHIAGVSFDSAKVLAIKQSAEDQERIETKRQKKLLRKASNLFGITKPPIQEEIHFLTGEEIIEQLTKPIVHHPEVETPHKPQAKAPQDPARIERLADLKISKNQEVYVLHVNGPVAGSEAAHTLSDFAAAPKSRSTQRVLILDLEKVNIILPEMIEAIVSAHETAGQRKDSIKVVNVTQSAQDAFNLEDIGNIKLSDLRDHAVSQRAIASTVAAKLGESTYIPTATVEEITSALESPSRGRF